jgi:hypothetical protein
LLFTKITRFTGKLQGHHSKKVKQTTNIRRFSNDFGLNKHTYSGKFVRRKKSEANCESSSRVSK